MKLTLFLLVSLAVTANAYSKDLTQHISNGTIFVGGSKASKQILIKQANKTSQLTNFSNWENIQELYVSPDKHYLIAYHRADKEKFYKITLYDLNRRISVATTAPGVACLDIKWLDNKILFISGATGIGTIVYVYNYNLKKQFDLVVGYLYIDTEHAVSFTYPVYAANDGQFTMYSLKTGEKGKSFDFKQKIKEGYILDSAKNIRGKTYKFVLWTLKTHKKVIIEKTLD